MIDDNRSTRLTLYGIAGIALFVALAPYIWMLRTTLLTNAAATSSNSPIIPFLAEGFTLNAYPEIWNNRSMGKYFKNSVIFSLSATVLALALSVPGAYAFARLDFPGRKILFYSAVFTIMFPWIVMTIPVYEVFLRVGLLNTATGIIIALTIFIQPVCLWLLQGFFRQGIPANLEEAALIDGTTELGAFFRIVLPLSAPAVAATAMFTFLSSWNNFTWVFIIANDENLYTAPVAIHYLLGTDSFLPYNALMAGVTLLILPPILFYGLSQRYVNVGLGGGP